MFSSRPVPRAIVCGIMLVAMAAQVASAGGNRSKRGGITRRTFVKGLAATATLMMARGTAKAADTSGLRRYIGQRPAELVVRSVTLQARTRLEGAFQRASSGRLVSTLRRAYNTTVRAEDIALTTTAITAIKARVANLVDASVLLLDGGTIERHTIVGQNGARMEAITLEKGTQKLQLVGYGPFVHLAMSRPGHRFPNTLRVNKLSDGGEEVGWSIDGAQPLLRAVERLERLAVGRLGGRKRIDREYITGADDRPHTIIDTVSMRNDLGELVPQPEPVASENGNFPMGRWIRQMIEVHDLVRNHSETRFEYESN